MKQAALAGGLYASPPALLKSILTGFRGLAERIKYEEQSLRLDKRLLNSFAL